MVGSMNYALEHGAGSAGSAIFTPSAKSSAMPAGGKGADDCSCDGGLKVRPANHNRLWTLEERAQVACFRRKGLTYGQIAIKFRVSRNAIAGVVNRYVRRQDQEAA